MTFGQRLRSKRKEKKLTTEALADAVNVCVTSIKGYEHDRVCPTIFIAADIARVLNVTLDWLIIGKDFEGEWTTQSGAAFKCSRCNTFNSYKDKFCPSCGAKMKGANDEQTEAD